MNDQTVLFSGRFDCVHCGHICTIQELGAIFSKVIVVVLDYMDARYSAEYRRQILATILGRSVGNYEVVMNYENYERISVEGAKKIPFDVYASGNPKCIAHMKGLGYRTLEVPRSWHYEASKEP